MELSQEINLVAQSFRVWEGLDMSTKFLDDIPYTENMNEEEIEINHEKDVWLELSVIGEIGCQGMEEESGG